MNSGFRETEKKNFGFTLAEVLITLAIIGIVAALTVPTLIQKYQKQVAVTRLKKAYSIISQALQLSQIDNGSVNTWDNTLDGHQFFEKYLKPYLKSVEEISASDLQKLAPRFKLNGTPYTGTTFGGESSESGTGAHFIIADGSQITINRHASDASGLWVGIDINGLKKPNKVGHDTFLFYLSSVYGLTPLGDKGPTGWLIPDDVENKRDYILSDVSYACNANQSGYWCSALIMLDGWEIKADYPWQ